MRSSKYNKRNDTSGTAISNVSAISGVFDTKSNDRGQQNEDPPSQDIKSFASELIQKYSRKKREVMVESDNNNPL